MFYGSALYEPDQRRRIQYTVVVPTYSRYSRYRRAARAGGFGLLSPRKLPTPAFLFRPAARPRP